MTFHFPSVHLSALPTHLHFLLQARLISASASRFSSGQQYYPYPPHPRPTPHQIFHLPLGASQKDIKARYYDLVRAHHPDSSACRLVPPAVRHARFQAITAAYDVLRGKSSGFAPRDPYREEVLRRKHVYQHYHNPRAEDTSSSRKQWTASPEDIWKDKFIIIVGILTMAVGLAPGLFILPFVAQEKHRAAVSNLDQAKKDAQEYGELRRNELRKRADDIRKARQDEIDGDSPKHSGEVAR